MKFWALVGVFSCLLPQMLVAKPLDMFLYYNSSSQSLHEIGIKEREVAKVFDDAFGPDSEELPAQVQYIDFYVSHYADDSYVFILNAPYNCGQIGCNTVVYRRDADGDLQRTDESATAVKCKYYADDKLLCIKGGYKPEVKAAPKVKGPIHYPAPRQR